MMITTKQEGVLAIACGVYIIIGGLLSKTLISESDVAATKEEREQPATSTGRIICVAIGLASCIYGAYLILS